MFQLREVNRFLGDGHQRITGYDVRIGLGVWQTDYGEAVIFDGNARLTESLDFSFDLASQPSLHQYECTALRTHRSTPWPVIHSCTPIRPEVA